MGFCRANPGQGPAFGWGATPALEFLVCWVNIAFCRSSESGPQGKGTGAIRLIARTSHRNLIEC
jgi:hypothetical protein